MCKIVEDASQVDYLLHCNRLESCQTFLAFHGMNFDVVEAEIRRIRRRSSAARVEAIRAAAATAAVEAAAVAAKRLSLVKEEAEAVAGKRA